MKGIITMLLILAIIPAAFSEIVPNYIEFRGNPGTVICEDIVIMHSGELHGEDMWGTSGPKKNPNLYKDSHDVYGLAVDYPEDLTVEGYKNISICVSANKSIEVYGVLIYKEPAEIGSSLSMGYGYGVWLSAKIGIVQEVTTTTIPEQKMIQGEREIPLEEPPPTMPSNLSENIREGKTAETEETPFKNETKQETQKEELKDALKLLVIGLFILLISLVVLLLIIICFFFRNKKERDITKEIKYNESGMMRQSIFLVLGSIIFLLFIPTFALANGPTKEWVVMVYLDGDNNLEQFGLNNINQMELIGSNDALDVIVLADWFSDTEHSYIYHIQHDDDINNINSPVVLTLDETNMGSPSALISFIDFVSANYPANNYMLALWNHGSGWKRNANTFGPMKGVVYDQTSGDYLTMLEIKSAIAESSIQKFDIIGFDACLMSMAEVSYQLRDSAYIMVASEEVEPVPGWPYDSILGSINATVTPSILANEIIADYMAEYDWPIVTMSAIDQPNANLIASAIDGFALSLIDNKDAYGDEIRESYVMAETMFSGDFKDVYHFAELISNDESILDEGLKVSAQNVMSAIQSNMISEHKPERPNAHGLSVYAPPALVYYSGAYDGLDFASDTHWDEFLTEILYVNGTSIVENASILLVDDDSGEWLEYFYKNALDDNNYTYSAWDVYYSGSPSYSLLSDYDIVIWFTGSYSCNLLTAEDTLNIRQYMDNGGSFLLSSQDLGYDFYSCSNMPEKQEFYNDYLHASYIEDSPGYPSKDYIIGIDGEITGGMNYNLSDGAGNNWYPDVIDSINNAFPIFKYTLYQGSGYAAIEYTGDYRLIYLAFPFESVGGRHDRSELMSALINRLDDPIGTHIEIFGEIGPYGSLLIHGTPINFGTIYPGYPTTWYDVLANSSSIEEKIYYTMLDENSHEIFKETEIRENELGYHIDEFSFIMEPKPWCNSTFPYDGECSIKHFCSLKQLQLRINPSPNDYVSDEIHGLIWFIEFESD